MTQAPPDPATCEETYRSTSRDWCELQLECNEQHLYAYCSSDGSDAHYCECGGNFGYQSYQFEGLDSTDPCQTVLDVCTSGEELTFDGEPQCVTDYQSASNASCDLGIQCTQSAQLGEGVSATLSEYQSAYCSDNGGNWYCQCSQGGGYATFDYQNPPGGLDTCNSALGLCDSVADAVPEGPVECERTYQSANDQWCDAQIQCTQDAVIGDLTIGVHAEIWTNCEQTSDTSWACSCNAGNDSVSFEVESEDGWETCNVAAEMCPELVTPTPGGSGRAIAYDEPIAID